MSVMTDRANEYDYAEASIYRRMKNTLVRKHGWDEEEFETMSFLDVEAEFLDVEKDFR